VPGTLVDTNVLIDIVQEDDTWLDWSESMLELAAHEGHVFINPIIYAEVAAFYKNVEDLEEALPRSFVRRLELPWDAGFLAGHAYLKYRRRGGARRSPLPDFYIGAHAAVAGLSLLTRDPKRYRAYFPTVRLIAP
jgi:predicted nucleic acid-binding protein